jgi:hypothetical protein
MPDLADPCAPMASEKREAWAFLPCGVMTLSYMSQG